MSDSIQVEPFEPDEAVPVDQLAAELTDSVGLPNDACVDDAVPNALADEIESYQEHADRRDQHLAEQEDNSEQVDDQPQGKGQRHVPLGALQEERTKRQQAQAQVAQLQAQMAAQQAQMQQFQQWQAQQQAAQQQAQIPAFEDDPEGHVNARLQQIEQAQQANVQRQQMEQAAAVLQHEFAQVAPAAQAAVAEFEAQHPDYRQAYQFLDAQVDAYMMQQAPGLSQEARAVQKEIALLSMVKDSQARGLSPARRIYEQAQALGFQSQHRTPNGQLPKAAPTSLSNLPAGGRAPDDHGKVSAKQVAAMSNEEFDAFFKELAAADRPQFGY